MEEEAAQPEFWDDAQAAGRHMQQIATLKETVDTWRGLEGTASSSLDLIALSLESNDDSLLGSLESEVAQLLKEVERREFELALSGEYDRVNCFLSIHAGAGGTESQDWAEMLMRMYLRWAERRRFKAEVIDVSQGEEAGIKSATIEIDGRWAYGYLKSERGVHRLVRLSPFDANKLRHTSFALVEVVPEVEDAPEIEVDNSDLRVDVFRASGAGGQHVQKNSTAVRLTHLPSGIVVSCQNERSQHQNRAMAMKVLKARLLEREMKRRSEEQSQLRGEHVSAGWGNQIRSYVLHPYQLIKDHRSGYETPNTESVLDGEIDPILEAYLKSMVGAKS
ncbi:MAG: peptide chain release factor 2 [Chloroflexi bacterium]|nr:MAG: peptide chain release factor 2 [Chloroflexota bacterium]